MFQKSLYSPAHLTSEAFAETWNVSLVVSCRLDEFFLGIGVELISSTKTRAEILKHTFAGNTFDFSLDQFLVSSLSLF